MDKPLYYAYCYKSGEIGFVQNLEDVPAGAKIFAEGKGKPFRDSVQAKCRLSYDNRTHLCPGLPEKDLTGFVLWHKWAFPSQARFLENILGVA